MTSRTDLDPATLAKSLRRMAGDGSMEWVHEPMQASVLLDMADMLDEGERLRAENAKLRELVRDMWHDGMCECGACGEPIDPWDAYCRHCGARLEDR